MEVFDERTLDLEEDAADGTEEEGEADGPN